MRMLILCVGLVAAAQAGAGELATERYSEVQLQVAREFLQRARDAAHVGDRSLAGSLAWQATLDARIALGMSESPEIRLGAASVADEARRLVRSAASGGP